MIDNSPFSDIETSDRPASKSLKDSFVTGEIPTWLSKSELSGTGTLTADGPSAAGGSKISVSTSGATGDQIAAASNFQIDPAQFSRAILRFRDVQIDSETESYVVVGAVDAGATNRAYAEFKDGGTTDRALNFYTTNPATGGRKTSVDSGIPYANKEFDFTIDINMAEDYSEMIMEDVKERRAGSNPTDPVTIMTPQVYATEGVVKTASVGQFEMLLFD